jgi:hypothetical protein
MASAGSISYTRDISLSWKIQGGGTDRGLPSLLHIQRVSSIERRVKNIGRMSTFAQRKLDGIFLVGFSPPIVALIQLEPTRKFDLHSPKQTRKRHTLYATVGTSQ